MRPRLLTVLATGALTLSLLGPTGAQADPPEIVPGPSLPEQASATAEEQAADALAEAQGLFAEKSPVAARRALAQDDRPDATMALNQLMRVYDDLSPSEQRQADRLFARPTDPGGDTIHLGADVATFEYEDGEETPVCGDTVCIHYASQPDDDDAPSITDTDPANGIPDAVDQALATAEQVHETYLDAGFRRPDGDGALGNEKLAPDAPADLVDIYLADTGAAGLYGYCTADDQSDGPPYYRAAYCVIDNDFASSQFPAHTPLENQQVTLAHEYFHAVQYAYDAFDAPWIMEATATWAEDELFDDVNDNRFYLKYGQLQRSRIPLDGHVDLNVYGNWIFFRHLTERWDDRTGTMPRLVLELWRKLSARPGAPDMYSTQAIQSVLAARGASFTTVYGQFADANRRPARTYEEGAAYKARRPAKTWRLSTSRRNTGGFFARLDHLTSLPLRYKPDSSLRKRDWKLRLSVDMPPSATAPVARVARYLQNGKVSVSTIRPKSTGASKKTLGFSARNVRYVELVLVNASRKWRHDGRRTDVSASVFRR